MIVASSAVSFGHVLEGSGRFRKLSGRLAWLFSVSLQFWNHPEGFRKLMGSLFGVVVLPGFRKLWKVSGSPSRRVQKAAPHKQPPS